MPEIKKNSKPDISAQALSAQNIKRNFQQELKNRVQVSKNVIRKNNSATVLAGVEVDDQKISIKKERSLLQLSRNLNERIKMERSTKAKLEELSDEQADRKEKIEKRMEEIKRRNILRMKELN